MRHLPNHLRRYLYGVEADGGGPEEEACEELFKRGCVDRHLWVNEIGARMATYTINELGHLALRVSFP